MAGKRKVNGISRVDLILSAVATALSVTVEQLLEDNRSSYITKGRHMAALLIHNHCQYGYGKTAKAIRRSLGATRNSIRLMSSELDAKSLRMAAGWPGLAELYRQIERKLKGGRNWAKSEY